MWRAPVTAVLRAVAHAIGRRAAVMPHGPVWLRGLSDRVRIGHDRDGVPHIRASSDADAFFAQGYCHAHDRFFQMDMLRRVLSGRLSEVVGQRGAGALGSTVNADHLMRVLGLRESAERVVAAGAPEPRRLLEAYVDGVNQCVAHNVRRRRPLEHRLLRIPLRPWTLVDSVVVAKGMSLGLSFKWRTAPIFAQIAHVLRDAPEKLDAILPAADAAGVTRVWAAMGASFEGLLSLFPTTPMQGSNAFVVGRGRSASGKPLLASDPHLTLGLPNVWHLASVRGDRYQAVGASLPGLPGIVLGRTPTLAWGLTNGMADDADLWEETIDDTGRRYRLDDAWAPLSVETQEIARRGRAPHLIRVRRTHRGPLLTDAIPGYDGPPLSLRMTLHEATQDLETFLALGRARTVDEGLAALEAFGSPVQNIVLADSDGEAAFRLMGNVPTRVLGRHPALPQPGATRAYDWTGVLAHDAKPAHRLAPEDVVVTANDPHPPVEGVYITHLYEPSYRAARLRALLHDKRNLTREDLSAAQVDTTDLAMVRFRAEIIECYAEGARRTKPVLGALLDRLLAYEGDTSPHASCAVATHLLYHHLVRRTFAPALGDYLLQRWLGQMNLVDQALHNAFGGEDSAWAPRAVRPTLFLQALEDTDRALRANRMHPETPWGAWHTLTLAHPAGRAAWLSGIFNRGPMPVAGSPFTAFAGQYHHCDPGPMVVGASYRHTIDMANPEAGRMVLVGGQSGHVGSRHYDDQIARWHAGDGIPMRLSTDPPDARWTTLIPR